MAIYQYQALDSNGAPQQGEIEADSEEQARELLMEQGLVVLNLEEEQILEMVTESHGEDILEVPLTVSFRLLAEEASTSQLRSGFQKMYEQLERGVSIDETILMHEKELSTHVAALLKMGLNHGNLSTILHQFTEYAQHYSDEKRRFWSTLAYPALLMMSMALMFFFFMLYLIPQFKKIFEDFGTELPGITEFVIGLSSFLVGYWNWIVILLIVLGGILLIGSAALRAADKRFFESSATYIPILGRIRFYSSYSFYCRLLAVLLENRVPLIEAMSVAENVTENAVIIARSNHLRSDIQKGRTYNDLLPELNSMPAGIRQAFRWMNDEKSMACLLRGAAESCSIRVKLIANIFRIVVEPIAMITIAILMGMIVIALFMPLLKLLNDLS